jgi:preprotein translocase subunit YajC
MYGTVSAVDGDDVILEIAPGVDVRILRRAVMEVLSPGEPEETEETETVADAHDEEYADDEASDEDAEPSDAHDSAEFAEDGLADSHDGNRAKSDKDNVF